MIETKLSACPECKRRPDTIHEEDTTGASWITCCPGCGLSAWEATKPERAARNWERLVTALAPPEQPSVSAAYLKVYQRLDNLGVQDRGGFLVERCAALLDKCEASGMVADHDGGLEPLPPTRRAPRVSHPRAKRVAPTTCTWEKPPHHNRDEPAAEACPQCGRPYPEGMTTCPACAAGEG